MTEINTPVIYVYAMTLILTIINTAGENSLPSGSHGSRTGEYTVNTTTVSKLYFARLAACIDFFPFDLFVLFQTPFPTKATVYFVSLATKACDQSFITYDAAKCLQPLKTDICITQDLIHKT